MIPAHEDMVKRYAALSADEKFWVNTQMTQAIRNFPERLKQDLDMFPNAAMWELAMVQLEHSKANGRT
jgi:hypothetical protein